MESTTVYSNFCIFVCCIPNSYFNNDNNNNVYFKWCFSVDNIAFLQTRRVRACNYGSKLFRRALCMMWHNDWVRQAMCEWCDTMIELGKLCVNDVTMIELGKLCVNDVTMIELGKLCVNYVTQWLSWASYVWIMWHNDWVRQAMCEWCDNDWVRQAMCEWCDTMSELGKLCVNDVTQWWS